MHLTCTRCGASEESTRRSEDKMEEDLTHLGWVTGLPKQQKWCPRCATEPYRRTDEAGPDRPDRSERRRRTG